MPKTVLKPLSRGEPVALAVPERGARSSAIPLSLYVHWPWCVKKCPYCDFNSHALNVADDGIGPAESIQARYVAALQRELMTVAPWAQGRSVQSVFIGGGTPSLMLPSDVARLLESVDREIGLSSSAEITLEANPGATEVARYQDFRAAGVNRLSIGIQSLDDAKLKRLGRIHSAHQARAAMREAVRVFDNVNFDLMYALPTESLVDLEQEVNEVVSLGAPHLSFYQLTIEDGTVFAKQLPSHLPDEDLVADMSDMVESKLLEAGYEHYEVSGYAQPNRRCHHNLNYWTYGDYLAIGAGAHAKVTTQQGIYRWKSANAPKRYLEFVEQFAQAHDEAFWVPDREIPFEFMLNVLRLLDGVPKTLFTSRTALPESVVAPIWERLEQQGLLKPGAQLQCTELGRRFLSDVQEAFLPD